MASAVEDRDAKISLAKEKLKKFQKKKTTQSSNASISHTVETSSLAGDSVNGSAGDLSLRSSPGLDMRSAVNSSDRRMSEEMGEGLPERRNGHVEGNWPANNGHHFVEISVASQNDVMSSASGDFMTSSSTALNGHNGQDVEEIQRLKRTIDDLVHQNRMLNKEVEMERNSVESKIIGEHQNLREQLTSHIQTIGILVAEKTELQAALTQADFIAKKKASEADNYAAKLSELHEKMTHHERSLNRSSLDGEAQEARFAEQSKEIDKLRETNRSLEQSMDQIRDELYECKRKLGMKDVEVKSLQDRAADLQSRLDSASSLSESTQRKSSFSDLQSEQASGEKKKLEARVHEYQTQISRLQLDMEQMVSRYQALLTQVTSAKDAKQIDPALVSQVEDLQKANQQLQNEIVDLKQEKNHLMGASSEKDDALSRSQSERAQREKVLSQQSEEIESLRSQSIKTSKNFHKPATPTTSSPPASPTRKAFFAANGK
ncbi:hypothetical protein BV898_06480 [Hypsibius exemplaris]|uniref:Uncharacterized protein n=1 Tax=Hypsibius exemplaris TaxID=2072580 RepID=A0A1W0WWB7_HYPEX|nr:hypothetical protein BV898_06480 [Hypsibius exemplaris]